MKKTKPIEQLDHIIELMENHYKSMSEYNKILMRKFTYEKKEFTACMTCGHSDKALIYELKKLRKLL